MGGQVAQVSIDSEATPLVATTTAQREEADSEGDPVCDLFILLITVVENTVQWCVICRDGGRLLECACGRSVCFDCIPQLQEVEEDRLAKWTFKCPVCEGATHAVSKCYQVPNTLSYSFL